MTFGPGPQPGQLGEVDPAVVARVLDAAGERVTAINETTRQGLAEVIAQGVEQGMGAAELGDAIQNWSGWDEYRAELIARTETGMAFNETALATYRDSGVEQVHVTDGDDDDICAPYADWTGPIDEAPEALGHPNCTRDFEPIVSYTAEDYAAAGVPVPEELLAPSVPMTTPSEAIAPSEPLAPESTEAWQRATDDREYAYAYGHLNYDNFMTDLGNEIGFGALPTQVSAAEMDGLVQRGALELWRGETQATYADQFINGAYRVGRGQYGNGIYTAWGPESRETAQMFGSGAQLRMALRADARIVDYAEASKSANLTVGTYDVGRWAMANGYDAIRVTYPSGGGEMVILNRGAVMVVS